MSSQDFLSNVLAEFAEAFEPLKEGLESTEDFEKLLAAFGWPIAAGANIQNMKGVIVQLSTAIASLDTAVATLKNAGTDQERTIAAANISSAIAALFNAVNNLTKTNIDNSWLFPFNEKNFWETFPDELLQYLIHRYIERRLPALASILHFTGVLIKTWKRPQGPSGRTDYLYHGVRWDKLPRTITQPAELFCDVYGWGTNFNHHLFLLNLYRLFRLLGLPVNMVKASDTDLDAYYDASASARKDIFELRALLYTGIVKDNDKFATADLELILMPILPKDNKEAPPNGFVLFPLFTGKTKIDKFQLAEGVDISLIGDFQSKVIKADIRPDGTNVSISTNDASLSALATITVKPKSPWILIGTAESSRIELSQLHVSLSAQGPVNENEAEYAIEVGADDAILVIDFGEGDGFLQKIIGDRPQRFDISVALRWSNKTGFGFKFSGQAKLERVIPVHKSIAGILDVDNIYIGLLSSKSDNSAVLQAALTGNVKLGPISATIDRMGLQTKLVVLDKDKPPGNLGDIDLSFAFKPPDGVGLVIDAGPVVGGGYLFFDHENGRYAGALQLNLKTITVTAIGIIDTKLPGGAEGFSFLIVITAKFPAIQLGFGFALSGLGGLGGIHRSIVVEVLQNGVRNRSIDNVMFPEDPVKNASQLISNLQSIFPPKEGRYVFGPMAIIAWGTPPIIEAELGIILELSPLFRLVILGQFHVVLPIKEAALVELHLDVLGVIDFEEKSLSIDASLHDSRVVCFSIYGDMALRLSWGKEPNFAFSVGGLHPQFQPPPGFPALRRLTVALGAGENPRISLQAYFALTSNSLQFGALAELYAESAGFNVYGWIGFDALFIFSPFSFMVGFSAGIAFRKNTTVIAGVHLAATLSGPAPWHAWGEAGISILFISVTVGFDAKFGEERRVEVIASDPWKALEDEIKNTGNWSATLPPASYAVVTLTTPGADESGLSLIDPLGGLTLREKAVPFDRKLTKFGEGRLPAPRRFTIEKVTVGSQPAIVGDPVIDYFAPGHFEEMSDAEKLSRPSFEQMQAGITIASDAVTFGSVKGKEYNYKTVIIDKPDTPPRKVKEYTLKENHQKASVRRGAAAQSLLRNSGLDKYAPPPSKEALWILEKEEYVIMDSTTLANKTAIILKEMIIPEWKPSTQYSVGDRILPIIPNGHIYKCTVAGITKGSEPAWSSISGASVIDNTVTWNEFDNPALKTKGIMDQLLAEYLVKHPEKKGLFEVVPKHEM